MIKDRGQNKPKPLHNVEVGYFDGRYYVMPLSQQSNRMWMGVRPLKLISEVDLSELAKAIDSVLSYSNPFDKESYTVSDKPSWTIEENRMFESATKLWSIRWYNDGSVKIEALEPFRDTSGKPGWRTIAGSERLLHAPADTPTWVNLLSP